MAAGLYDNITSIHGRRLGLDTVGNLTVLTGGFREAINAVTSASTQPTLVSGGKNLINVTSAATTASNLFIIPNPIPGVTMKMAQMVTGTTSTQGSTAIAFVRGSTAFLIHSSEGTTNVAILAAFNCSVTLEGVSSAIWLMTSRTATSAGVSVLSAT